MRTLLDRVAYACRQLTPQALPRHNSDPARDTTVNTILRTERIETSYQLRPVARSLEHWLDLNA
jgi:hypothetical protein